MNIKTGDSVRVLRDIERREGLYAKQGELGHVVEVFKTKPQSGGPTAEGTWYAKVKIGSHLKTLRLTSIEVVRQQVQSGRLLSRAQEKLEHVLEAQAAAVLYKHHPNASPEEFADALGLDLGFDGTLRRH